MMNSSSKGPRQIERESFAIIEEMLGHREFPDDTGPVVKRVVHTTADFEYADSLVFSANAVRLGVTALRGGADIVCDTNMVRAGINKAVLSGFGGQVHCFMAEEDVAAEAAGRDTTRAVVSMERAAKLPGPVVFAVGNAPTALIRLHELWRQGAVQPALVIGVPVGFVNVVESKELWMGEPVPSIIARGRKGGSNVAAAICNALLYLASGRDLQG